MKEGHGFAADWWSLGVLMFEMCAGLPPFYNEDRLAMYRAAVQARARGVALPPPPPPPPPFHAPRAALCGGVALPA